MSHAYRMGLISLYLISSLSYYGLRSEIIWIVSKLYNIASLLLKYTNKI